MRIENGCRFNENNIIAGKIRNRHIFSAIVDFICTKL